jgi:hypothetical protein
MEVGKTLSRPKRGRRLCFKQQALAILLPLVAALIEACDFPLSQPPVALSSAPAEAEIAADSGWTKPA